MGGGGGNRKVIILGAPGFQEALEVLMLFKKSRDLLLSLLDILVAETMEDGLLLILNLFMEEVPKSPVPVGLDGITRDL